MIPALIRMALSQRWLVLALAGALVALGVWAFQNQQIDAYPDISGQMVEVITTYPGRAGGSGAAGDDPHRDRHAHRAAGRQDPLADDLRAFDRGRALLRRRGELLGPAARCRNNSATRRSRQTCSPTWRRWPPPTARSSATSWSPRTASATRWSCGPCRIGWSCRGSSSATAWPTWPISAAISSSTPSPSSRRNCGATTWR